MNFNSICPNEAIKIFGFGKGKIEVFLEKYSFSSGESIKGKVILKLKKPIRARALKVGLRGERGGGVSVGIGGGRVSNRQKVIFYNFEMPLDREKDYLEGEYNFEIKIPANILEMPSGGVMGDVLRGVQFISGIVPKWYVIAKLDIPSGIDVSKKVQITIG